MKQVKLKSSFQSNLWSYESIKTIADIFSAIWKEFEEAQCIIVLLV